MKSIIEIAKDLGIGKDNQHILIDYLKGRFVGKEVVFTNSFGTKIRPNAITDVRFEVAKDKDGNATNKFVIFNCDVPEGKISYVVDLYEPIMINGEPDTRRRVCELDPYGEEDWLD